jgi:hypothetical protein
MKPNRHLVSLAVCLWALAAPLGPAFAGSLTPAANCAGGRFISTAEVVQRQNWVEHSPTIYERKETFVRLPNWLGRFTVVHASQGFVLSGEERVGAWTPVTVAPSVTVTLRAFGRSLYWGFGLPVVRETKACRDLNGNLYVR